MNHGGNVQNAGDEKEAQGSKNCKQGGAGIAASKSRSRIQKEEPHIVFYIGPE
jgi:hypothetical protein